ncbi:MAG: hypothetical protein AAF327_14415 [Cyanobacteria bacterium P01_A01_bin.37]
MSSYLPVQELTQEIPISFFSQAIYPDLFSVKTLSRETSDDRTMPKSYGHGCNDV